MSEVLGGLIPAVEPFGEEFVDSSREAGLILFAISTPNTTLPIITNFSPAVGESIGASDPVSFDVTDDEGLFERIALAVSFADGTVELAHDGDAFRGNYVGLPNNRVSITDGFRYTLRRVGNWPSAPTVEYFVIDDAGNSGVIA
jgi:hypothetical protein